ncbi:MAG: hypothetical protein KGS72_05480 [Cyanobacteria bacterium REEB67]|nr:hypothetical protein [Cyanobacteria bacterium REEB67]
MAFNNSRNKLLSALLASSFLWQSNLLCLAADNGTILKSPLLVAASQAPDSFVLTGGTSITPDQAQEKVDQLSKDILLKEIELERYNLHYTQEVAVQGRWKGWRYGGLQIANNGLGLAGAIIGTSYRGARLNDAAKVKPAIQEQANFIPEIGAWIGAGAAAMEFGINGYHDMIARRHGFSPTAAMHKVEGLKNEIDRMLAERDAITKIENASPSFALHAQIDAAEGKVLRDLRDQSLLEFDRFHVGARRLIGFQQMQYFLDLSKYTSNALGYEFGALSLHLHRRRYNGNAGALFIVSGALTMTAPMISRYFGKAVGSITEHRIKPIVGDAEHANIAALETDLASLDKLFKESGLSPDSIQRTIDREGIYGIHQKAFSDEIRAGQKKRADSKLSATQNVGAGLYVGGSKIASGVLFSIVGFHHEYNTKTPRANHVTNDDLFAGSVIGIPATAFSILDTLRIQVRGELKRKHLEKKGMLPAQLITLRLQQLDEQEHRIKGIKP